MIKQRLCAIPLLLLAVIPLPADADETFTATLVPRAGSGSSGTGSATLILNAAETEVLYTITFSGLTTPELAAHIHRPDGSVTHTLPLGDPKVGVWSNPGLLDLFNLRGSQLYILIHTQQNPGGELRGDIEPSQVPVAGETWGGIKALYR